MVYLAVLTYDVIQNKITTEEFTHHLDYRGFRTLINFT